MSQGESEPLISSEYIERNNRVNQLNNIQLEALNLFEKKNKDYGDAFTQDGVIGVLVRLGDKINRLKNISNNNITLVKTETLRDTLIDLHNYSAMAVMLLDENRDKNNNSTANDDNKETNNKESNNKNENISSISNKILDLDYDDLHYSNELRADDKCIIN